MGARHWSTDTYSVRERFGLGVVMLATLYCAVLLGVLRAVNAAPILIVFVFGLLGIVAVGQVAGRPLKMPRAVSMIAGALYTLVWSGLIALASGYALPLSIGALGFAFVLGAGAGYFAGGFVASVFLVHDWIGATWNAKRREREALAKATGHQAPESPWDDDP